MRVRVVWSAIAFLMLVTLSSALRTSQRDTGALRGRGRYSTSTETLNKTEIRPTFRPRDARRNEISAQDASNSRSRLRSSTSEPTVVTNGISQVQFDRRESFDSKKSSTRIRSRPVLNEATFDTVMKKDTTRSRTRNIPNRSSVQSPRAHIESTTLSESKVRNINLETKSQDFPIEMTKEYKTNKQVTRRSSTARTVDIVSPTSVRGRINTRVRSLDLDVSGTINTMTVAAKEPTTARSEEIRNSRKLRYKTRLSETDTNLTGTGIALSNDIKSSQEKENGTSQPETQSVSLNFLTPNQRPVREKTSTLRTMKVFKRPLSRGSAKSEIKVEKFKVSDEISEDDNYPESFKALIQAKNASTYVSSPSESLALTASQKEFNVLTTTSQSNLTGPDTDDWRKSKQAGDPPNGKRQQSPIDTKDVDCGCYPCGEMLRSKIDAGYNISDIKNDSKKVAESIELTKPRMKEFRSRGLKSQEESLNDTSVISSTIPISSTQKSYKFSRSFKRTTTEVPVVFKNKGVNLSKKITNRSHQVALNVANYSNNITSEIDTPIEGEKKYIRKFTSTVKPKPVLPRTSYYARSRNNPTKISSTTNSVLSVADKKIENTSDMPIIFTHLNDDQKSSEIKTVTDNISEKVDNGFIIRVTSKESLEHGNDVNSNIKNSIENSAIISTNGFATTTQKYHAIYKDKSRNSTENKEISTVGTPIKNLQTRKYSRKNLRQKHNENEDAVTQKSRDRSLKKYSDTFSKTTESTSNGIKAESEKTKTKFSSKYRASYLNRPFYKPTVPSITSSTAWLKFFVTDESLLKSVEEPNWFMEEDLIITTTEEMSRENILSTQSINNTTLNLVEGEEIQLGSDMNAIAITKPRSPLTSADLKLSESFIKPSPVMNVEASNHSPSVTVSIFDALAEILTSTPRSRISSTTQVLQIQKNNENINQVLDGVSSKNNVNIDLANRNILISNDNVNTNVNIVKTTEQTTQNVFNNMLVGESKLPSPNTKEDVSTTVTARFTDIPTTPSSTPISQRKPFAIKVLYSETETPIDRTTSLSTATTDSTATVYNTVSDLLLSNNRLVSSELTSMLANNIKSIIKNMEDDNKSKLLLDMDKILNSLIPKALNRRKKMQDDEDNPNTTPYSLEDLRDTENINISGSENLNNSPNFVNNLDVELINTTTESVTAVNSSRSFTLQISTAKNTMSTSEDETTTVDDSLQNINILTTSTDKLPIDTVTTSDVDSVVVERETETTLTDLTNKSPPIPFLPNFDENDFKLPAENNEFNLNLKTPSNITDLQNVENIEDPSQLSRLQLWILSKKARVLKMIEDLIKTHNDEIASTLSSQLTDIAAPNNFNFSNRLPQIMNSMTTEMIIDNKINVTTEMTIPPTKTTIFAPIPYMSENSFNIMRSNLAMSTQTISNLPESMTESSTVANTNDINTTLESLDIGTTVPTLEKQEDTVTLNEADIAVTSMNTVKELQNENTSSMDTAESTTEKITEISTAQNLEFTTEIQLSETTFISSDQNSSILSMATEGTKLSDNMDTTTLSFTTDNIFETTTQVGEEISVNLVSSYINSNNSKSSSASNETGQRNIPKKDYVIFGILPNNTVVRKDPNNDVLESLTEASPYIIYGVLPNNTVIRKFPNGTRVPRIMQKIDILPISPWSLRNPYSPIHNIPAIVRPQSNPIRVSTNTVTSQDTSNNDNGTENKLTNDTVNNLQVTMSTTTPNLNDSSSLGITSTTIKLPVDKSTASHVLSLRTTTMLPSLDEILLHSIISSAIKEEMVISSVTSSTHEPRILTLDIDPETQQIRTEKPSDGNGSAIFKFIPIDEVTVSSQESNVLKLASSKNTKSTTTASRTMPTTTDITTTESNMDVPQLQINTDNINEPTTTLKPIVGTTINTNVDDVTIEFQTPALFNDATVTTTNRAISNTDIENSSQQNFIATTTEMAVITTTQSPISSLLTTTTSSLAAKTTVPSQIIESDVVFTNPVTTVTSQILQESTTSQTTTSRPLLTSSSSVSNNVVKNPSTEQTDTELLQNILKSMERNPKNLSGFSTVNQLDGANLIQMLLSNRLGVNNKVSQTNTHTPTHSIEEDIRQFEEDTKLLTALLRATGRNPADFNLPTLDKIQLPTTKTPFSTTQKSTTTTITPETTTTTTTTTVKTAPVTLSALESDIKKLQEDAKLLQALLQITNTQNVDSLPIISGTTSNVRVSGSVIKSSEDFKATTPVTVRPVYSTRPSPVFSTEIPSTISTLQPQQQSTEEIRISTTFRPTFNERSTTARSAPRSSTSSTLNPFNSRFALVTQFTTEIPSTSTFSDEEDLRFLQNLKSVLGTQNSKEDPETQLANRVIALAVERSLNEIQSGKDSEPQIKSTPRIGTTTTFRTTTPTTTPSTTMPSTTTIFSSTPSIEEDIKQFEEDTKLLRALLKVTGQDPSKLNLPVLTDIKKPETVNLGTIPTTVKTYGAKIAVKDNLKNEQDDAKLLQTLIKLQDVQETTTQRAKLAITGQSSDEALKKLIQKAQPTGMVSEATKPSISLSTEYGNTNDALLAALLKEQGFGPTTASSLDEQIRLAALLNQVVVTPKARRTTTPPPPPPPPRRPILDGLAWLWQQWRETAPGPDATRANRGPASSARPSAQQSSATSSRVNWFGSGPFVGEPSERPANRIPLEPPSAVTDAQAPGRGQLVSAAINVTRAFSQFLGAAIQGAAQTVQSVIRAGQRAASDAYTSGSG